MSINVRLWRRGQGGVEKIELHEYAKGVVPAEVYPSWPPAALEAQALAALTFARFAILHPRHISQGADLCDSTCCQAYDPAKRSAQTDKAVEAVRDRYIYHVPAGADPIEALYFAHCNGKTRSSEDYDDWRQVPYLRSVPCICGYHDYYGHGVGMCQWGAKVMADQGATSAEIAEHYYTNCKVSGAPEPPPEKASVDIWTWNSYGELPGVAITLGDRYGITDSGGYLRFEDMLPGAHGLGARKEGYEEIARGEVLLPGENEIDIAMEKEAPPEPPRPAPWWCPYATAFADWLDKLIACKCGSERS